MYFKCIFQQISVQAHSPHVSGLTCSSFSKYVRIEQNQIHSCYLSRKSVSSVPQHAGFNAETRFPVQVTNLPDNQPVTPHELLI